ncbi:ribosomal protein HS6-type (S12/L30/L7a) [Desulfosporosinus orientis DSM 765]|uniref:Ribosomal protein HS6-type (S12/L30/L7a) n=1 Tax=Desulfosporosinus orientis (strain ATCC 19365 / DSM 765 / NCIMB 8382 / VKM B-1628 / Singapore I) TaxID=768706 RepID=G7W9W1_DESOD|nr:ribosomal L7Ae/L30e/S12e/Gadd45 family protein [Desulfosporosinus orientis]AET65957.1 ribosomal protein HS6-type (S12/L30/L7a) [Desulfosporosinus orientis DSM 765]
MLDETFKHAKQKTVGLKQTQRALEKGRVRRVFIAKDAEIHVRRPVVEWCEDHGIECIDVPTMSELGKACGIEVGTAVAAILHD